MGYNDYSKSNKYKGDRIMNYRVYNETNWSAYANRYFPRYFKTKKEAMAYAQTISNPTVERKLVETWVKY